MFSFLISWTKYFIAFDNLQSLILQNFSALISGRRYDKPASRCVCENTGNPFSLFYTNTVFLLYRYIAIGRHEVFQEERDSP
jgi:hypothetical protein